MKQYLELLSTVKEKGVYKSAARENMPGTYSLFGYQFRHDLSKGFPLITTKKVGFKSVVYELLWFLRGDTNIKYLIDNKVNIWNEDAYNYFLKISKSKLTEKEFEEVKEKITFEKFVEIVQEGKEENTIEGYIFGDCGFQYGKLWRNWNGIDQIKNQIQGLKSNPYSRRHIVSAWKVDSLNDMALNACHSFVQFNCRPLSDFERVEFYNNKNDCSIKRSLGNYIYPENYVMKHEDDIPDPIGFELSSEDCEYLDNKNIPRYYLDCQLYQRSADLVLGVPYNIASYALLTHLISEICNMIPGEFVHTFGDVHIYEDHLEAVKTQLERKPFDLPSLKISDELKSIIKRFNENKISLNELIRFINSDDFIIENYNYHQPIKAKLSTGLK